MWCKWSVAAMGRRRWSRAAKHASNRAHKPLHTISSIERFSGRLTQDRLSEAMASGREVQQENKVRDKGKVSDLRSPDPTNATGPPFYLES